MRGVSSGGAAARRVVCLAGALSPSHSFSLFLSLIPYALSLPSGGATARGLSLSLSHYIFFVINQFLIIQKIDN